MDSYENDSPLTPDGIIANLQATILELREVIKQHAILIERLQHENAELRERLNKISRNSSKPPSYDGLAIPVIPACVKNLKGNKARKKAIKGMASH